MNEEYIFRLGEIIFDITCVACSIMDRLGDADEVNSRVLYASIYDAAIEFNQTWDEDSGEDYMLAVTKFAEEWFGESAG